MATRVCRGGGGPPLAARRLSLRPPRADEAHGRRTARPARSVRSLAWRAVLRRSLVPALLAAMAVALLLGLASAAQGSDRVTATAPAMPDGVVEAVAGASSPSLSPAAGVVGVAWGEAGGGDVASAVAGEPGGESPCVVRADCAGALVLGGLGLVLALPVMTPSIGAGIVPTGRVAGPPRLLHSTLWATRLDRPPQPS